MHARDRASFHQGANCTNENRAASTSHLTRRAMSRASAHVGDEPGTKAGGDDVDEDEDGDFQDDRHLQALKRKRWQPPASEPLRSAAAGSRAHATSMDDLPLEVYPLIIAHLPVHSAARLALVSTVWNAALARGLVSADFHTSLQAEYRYASKRTKGPLAQLPDLRAVKRAVADDALRLLGAVTCRLDGPAATIELVRRMAPFFEIKEWFEGEELFFPENGVGGFAEALNKCRRASEWSAEKVFECMDILAQGPFRLLKKRDADLEDSSDLDDSLHLECAKYFANDIQSFAGAFGSVDDEAVLKLCLDKMPVRSDRSKVIMSWFADFVDFPYDFTEDHAARIGLFVASAALPIADVVDLVDHLQEQEDEAEGSDWIDARGCLCTVATLGAWARAASFPTQWPAQAQTSMFVALSRWSATDAADVAFEGRVARLAMRWAMELLAPHVSVLEETGVTDGPVLVATRLLQIFSA